MKRTPIRRKTPLRASTPLARGGPIARTGRIRRKPRPPSEYARIYGSKARVRWVKARPCVCCETVDPRRMHNHHTASGGKGRKADAHTIVPCCHGCHDLHHRGKLGRSLEWWQEQARQTDAAWLASRTEETDE